MRLAYPRRKGKWVAKRGASLDFYAFPDEIYDVFADTKLFRETNCYFCYVEARSWIRLKSRSVADWAPYRVDFDDFVRFARDELGQYTDSPTSTSLFIASEDITPWRSIEEIKRQERVDSSGEKVERYFNASGCFCFRGKPCLQTTSRAGRRIEPGYLAIAYESIDLDTGQTYRSEAYYQLYKKLRYQLKKLCRVKTYPVGSDCVLMPDRGIGAWASPRIAARYREGSYPLECAPLDGEPR